MYTGEPSKLALFFCRYEAKNFYWNRVHH
jgi:hypothetical protein